jgi:Putative  PD-(D/E)XK family member, (DUF4420)
VTDLGTLYASLSRPPTQAPTAPRTFHVRAIAGSRARFIGRSANDHPAILIEVVTGRARAPIVLQNLMVAFNVRCSLSLPIELRETSAAVIECLAVDEGIQRHFLTVSSHLLDTLGDDPTSDEIATAIDALVSLFQKLARPPKRDAQALFGELAVIGRVGDAARLLKAWHSDPLDRFDFASDGWRLEVKTSATRQRRHEFSLEQCVLPPGTVGVLASIFVETAGGGLALAGLIDRVEARLSSRPDLVIKLHAVVADTLGIGLPHMLDHRFDEHLALASMAFYDLATIPAIRFSLPPEVSSVRFRSDIGGLRSIPTRELGRLIPPLAGLLDQVR